MSLRLPVAFCNVLYNICTTYLFVAECLHMSLRLPVAFCYVPCQQQIQQYLNKNSKTKKESRTIMTSPVDRKISFFGLQGTCGEMSADQTGSESHWSHLQQDKLWETVLEYYYSLCNVSIERRSQALNIYIKRQIKQKSERRESKKSLSYAEIAHKLGILTVNKTPTGISKQTLEDTVGNRTELEGTSCTETTSSTSGFCDTVHVDGNITEQNSANGCSAKLPCDTLASDSVIASDSNSQQTRLCDTAKHPSMLSDSQPLDKLSLKSSSDKDSSCQLSLHNDCRTSSASSGSHGPRYTNVPIDLEKVHMERLSSVPSNSWDINNDLVLVRFLCEVHEKSNPGRSKVRNEGVNGIKGKMTFGKL